MWSVLQTTIGRDSIAATGGGGVAASSLRFFSAPRASLASSMAHCRRRPSRSASADWRGACGGPSSLSVPSTRRSRREGSHRAAHHQGTSRNAGIHRSRSLPAGS